MKPCENQSSTNSGPESGNWTLVDEGGEEVSSLTALKKLSAKTHYYFTTIDYDLNEELFCSRLM